MSIWARLFGDPPPDSPVWEEFRAYDLVLRAALRECAEDGPAFDAKLAEVIAAWSGETDPAMLAVRYRQVRAFLQRHVSVRNFDAGPRVQAEEVAAKLPAIFGIRNPPRDDAPPTDGAQKGR